MKRNIAIVAGGDTSEIVVSCVAHRVFIPLLIRKSIICISWRWKAVAGKYNYRTETKCRWIETTLVLRNGTEKVVFDFAYITIHGTPGEDGRLQGYFDMMRIPYSCCGVLAAAITYDKFTCNQYLKAFGVRIAESLLLRQGQSVSDEEVVEKIYSALFYQA